MADPKPKTLAHCILQGGIQGKRFRKPSGQEYVVQDISQAQGQGYYFIHTTNDGGGRDVDFLGFRGKDVLVEEAPAPQPQTPYRESIDNKLLGKE